MSEDKQRDIFAQNLNYYIARSEKAQIEIAGAIGVSPQTFNTWCRGIAIPRMGKVQALANYFHINKSQLIDEHSDSLESTYYLDNDTAKTVQKIYENDRILFDAYNSTYKEKLVAYAKKLQELEEMEKGDF